MKKMWCMNAVGAREVLADRCFGAKDRMRKRSRTDLCPGLAGQGFSQEKQSAHDGQKEGERTKGGEAKGAGLEVWLL